MQRAARFHMPMHDATLTLFDRCLRPREDPQRVEPAANLARMDRLELFATLAAEHPDDPRARYGYANELYRAERWAAAIDELRAYLALAEDEGNGWGKLGDALARVGRVDEAADAYLTGIDQAAKFGHSGMADDFATAMDEL